MSSSIAIPKRRHASNHHHHHDSHHDSHGHRITTDLHHGSTSSNSSASSSSSSRDGNSNMASPSPSIMTASPTSSSVARTPKMVEGGWMAHERRPSLLSSSISRSEHTVIDVGHSEAPRLITCIKASQGFDWNQDLFLPSYSDYDSTDLETRQDPVEDIVLTDEEVAAMFPQ